MHGLLMGIPVAQGVEASATNATLERLGIGVNVLVTPQETGLGKSLVAVLAVERLGLL